MSDHTVLAVWAHPDDESFGPGGLFRALHDAGVRVVQITATQGEAGRPGNSGQMSREELAALRTRELRTACDILGIDRLEHWNYPDGELAEIESNLIREHIFNLITEEQPSVVITFGPDGITGHPDHLVISNLTTQAFAQYVALHSAETPPRLYYTTPTGDEIIVDPDRTTPLPLPPTTRIDVSQYAAIKRQALEAHATQHEDWERLLDIPDWFKLVYLHRAYPPFATTDPPETTLFP